MAHSVSNESLKMARITIQPSKNYCAVSPRVNVTGGEFQRLLDMREYTFDKSKAPHSSKCGIDNRFRGATRVLDMTSET